MKRKKTQANRDISIISEASDSLQLSSNYKMASEDILKKNS